MKRELNMSELTKRALSNALKELLKEKPVNKITIAELCNKVGIRQQTFYYHFADLPELIEWTCYVEVESVLKENRHYSSWKFFYGKRRSTINRRTRFIYYRNSNIINIIFL